MNTQFLNVLKYAAFLRHFFWALNMQYIDFSYLFLQNIKNINVFILLVFKCYLVKFLKNLNSYLIIIQLLIYSA